ncbi:MAG: universal stress protein [Candidatus Binatia bacterium]
MTPPTRLRRVLVAVDLSPHSAAVLERAAQLPLAANAAITVLHVLPGGLGPALVPDTEAEAEAQRGLAAAAVQLTEGVVAGIEVATALVYGAAFVEIIRGARQEGAELVVLGRHGRRAFADALIGSTAERVVRKGDVPVLVVNAAPRGPYRRPMVAVDLSDTSRRALALALRVIDAQAEPLTVLHSWSTAAGGDPAERNGDALGDFLGGFGDAAARWEVAVRPGDARAVILDEAVRRRVDLLVLGTHGRSGLAHALVGSVAEAVVRAATCDVLLARAEGHAFALP